MFQSVSQSLHGIRAGGDVGGDCGGLVGVTSAGEQEPEQQRTEQAGGADPAVGGLPRRRAGRVREAEACGRRLTARRSADPAAARRGAVWEAAHERASCGRVQQGAGGEDGHLVPRRAQASAGEELGSELLEVLCRGRKRSGGCVPSSCA